MDMHLQLLKQLLVNAAVGTLAAESLKGVIKALGDKFGNFLKHKDTRENSGALFGNFSPTSKPSRLCEKNFP